MSKCPKNKAWTKGDIPSQKGKVALITGGIRGLGYETALALAEAGATVIIAGRNEDKGKEAIAKIKALHPTALVEFGLVDLGSLTSIAELAASVSKKYEALDILVNNAGVIDLPKREVTEDGFEIQLGTNYLSHFALTAHLLAILRKSPAPRVVNVSAVASRQGKINFKDLQSEKCGYGWNVYSQSKIAVLIFGLELQRRSDAGGWGLQSITAHPGIAQTDLVKNGPQNDRMFAFFNKWLIRPWVSQSAEAGVLPQLYAATAPDAKPGGYYGPNGFYEIKGDVAPASIPAHAKDTKVAAKLWDVSTELTKVQWG